MRPFLGYEEQLPPEGPNDTSEALSTYVELMARHGPDSLQAHDWFEKHRHLPDFVPLAEESRNLERRFQQKGPPLAHTPTKGLRTVQRYAPAACLAMLLPIGFLSNQNINLTGEVHQLASDKTRLEGDVKALEITRLKLSKEIQGLEDTKERLSRAVGKLNKQLLTAQESAEENRALFTILVGMNATQDTPKKTYPQVQDDTALPDSIDYLANKAQQSGPLIVRVAAQNEKRIEAIALLQKIGLKQRTVPGPQAEQDIQVILDSIGQIMRQTDDSKVGAQGEAAIATIVTTPSMGVEGE